MWLGHILEGITFQEASNYVIMKEEGRNLIVKWLGGNSGMIQPLPVVVEDRSCG